MPPHDPPDDVRAGPRVAPAGAIRALLLPGLCGPGLWLVASAWAAEPLWRWQAPVVLDHPAAFVVLPLPASSFARSEMPALADLRLLDAQGQRVPFAFLPPAPQPPVQAAPLRLFPLPPQREGGGDAGTAPLTVEIDRAQVRVQPAAPTRRGRGRGEGVSPGWLVDLSPATAVVTALRFSWSGPVTFAAPYTLETSDNLTDWQPAGGGQLMSLQSDGGLLTQAEAPLPDRPARYVRLRWADPLEAPVLTQALPVHAGPEAPADEPPATLIFSPTPALPGAPAGAVCFDLGGLLPVNRVDIDPGPAPRVLPLRLEGRSDAGQPWQAVAQGVSYRIERDGQRITSPALPVTGTWRHLCVLPDERAGAAGALKLTVQVHPPRLVFAQQGTAPYTLHVGAAGVNAGAMPASQLVPMLEAERPRFGHATLGPWSEDATAVIGRAAQQRKAMWQRGALWAVLLVGVGVLGAMVWRLARHRAP